MANSLKNKFKYSALAALIVTLLSCTVMAFAGLGFGAPVETATAETGVSAQSNATLAAAWNRAVQESIDGNGKQVTFTLTENWTAAASDAGFGTGVGFGDVGYLLVPAGANIVMDLNGRTLNRNNYNTMNGYSIRVEGNLTITSATKSNAGTITGSSGGYGGAVLVFGGNLTLDYGTISGNNGIGNNGGGVYVYGGTFTMNGGVISDNVYSNLGGGVYVVGSSTFTMNGGEISGNTAHQHGGGVYVDLGTFIMNDGTISGNVSGDSGLYDGGGVYVYSNGEV